MQKPPRSPLDPESIFRHAYCFQWSNEHLRKKKHTTPDEFPFVASPSMVLSALASELYFKCIIRLETGKMPDDIHDLNELFFILSEPVQQKIEILWNFKIKEPSMIEVIKMIEKRTGDTVPRDLAWALEAGSRAFVQIRYLYEPASAQTKFLLADLPKILRTVILQIKPEWAKLGPPSATLRTH